MAGANPIFNIELKLKKTDMLEVGTERMALVRDGKFKFARSFRSQLAKESSSNQNIKTKFKIKVEWKSNS